RKEELDRRFELKTAEQVAESLGQMKGVLMKLGQMASFIDDAVPEAFRDALAELQSDAPPMAPELAARVVEDELDAPPGRVFAERSTGRVLTTALAEGVRFKDVEEWEKSERNMAAEAVYRFAFRSVWRYRVFNGDPHPGNYLFRPGGQVTFLDFGLVKRFTE